MRDARFAVALAQVCCLVVWASSSAAQDSMASVRQLCVAGSGGEASIALDTEDLAPGNISPESPEYTILCLLALGKLESARTEIEKLVVTHPHYRSELLNARGTPAPFEKIRRRLVPQLIHTEYTAAKAHFDTKDYGQALRRFDRMLWLLEDTPDTPPFDDLRLIARGFRDLAKDFLRRSAPLPARRVDVTGAFPGGATYTSVPAEPDGTVYDSSAAAVVPPVPLKPILPPASREFATLTPTRGLFEILIDEKGQVESAAVKRSVSPQYDQLVLREVRNWRYRPATLSGRAVRFRKVIEIYTAPLDSIRPD